MRFWANFSFLPFWEMATLQSSQLLYFSPQLTVYNQSFPLSYMIMVLKKTTLKAAVFQLICCTKQATVPCVNHKHVLVTNGRREILIVQTCFWVGLTSSCQLPLRGSLVQQHSEVNSPLSALIDVVLAVGSLKARLTLARVAVDVVGARASVPARFTQTLIGIYLTFIAVKSG